VVLGVPKARNHFESWSLVSLRQDTTLNPFLVHSTPQLQKADLPFVFPLSFPHSFLLFSHSSPQNPVEVGTSLQPRTFISITIINHHFLCFYLSPTHLIHVTSSHPPAPTNFIQPLTHFSCHVCAMCAFGGNILSVCHHIKNLLLPLTAWRLKTFSDRNQTMARRAKSAQPPPNRRLARKSRPITRALTRAKLTQKALT
jgi:hypothetical protein